jgi:hypothetical protein
LNIDKSDILYLYLCDTTFLDLMEILDTEQLKKFILIFGGTSINIPSIADIKNCGRDFRIYSYIEKHKQENKSMTDIYNEAAKIFFCSQTNIKIIYGNLKKYSDRLEEQRKKLEQILM